MRVRCGRSCTPDFPRFGRRRRQLPPRPHEDPAHDGRFSRRLRCAGCWRDGSCCPSPTPGPSASRSSSSPSPISSCTRTRSISLCACTCGGATRPPPAASRTAARTATSRSTSPQFFRPTPALSSRASPFAIIASVFNLEDHLEEFMEAFGPYRDRVWLISDGSTDNTVLRLRQAGWRCFDDGVNRRKPRRLRRLLERLPAHIETVMVIDPDIRITGAGRRQHDRCGSVRQRLPAIRRRRSLPADHDRARRISGAIPGFRIRARVSRRARESRGLQHHLRRILLSAQRTGTRARASIRCPSTPRISRTP